MCCRKFSGRSGRRPPAMTPCGAVPRPGSSCGRKPGQSTGCVPYVEARGAGGAMNRDEIAELAAGYALGALDADDRARFDALLASGDAEAAAALRDFEGAVAGVAAESVEAPPPAVKAALMARIDAQGRSREAGARTLSSVKPSPSGRSAWTL